MPLAPTQPLTETQVWRSYLGCAGVRVASSLNGVAMRSKRPLFSTRFALRLLTIMGISTLGAMACGADPVDPEEPDDPEYNPGFMVGDWLADSLVMTSVANSEGSLSTVFMSSSPRRCPWGRRRKRCGSEWVTPSSWRVIANSISTSTARPRRPRSDRCSFPTDGLCRGFANRRTCPGARTKGQVFHVKHLPEVFFSSAKSAGGTGACFT